jgi:hypothetical protein
VPGDRVAARTRSNSSKPWKPAFGLAVFSSFTAQDMFSITPHWTAFLRRVWTTVPGEDAGALEDRFRTACKRVTDQVKVHRPSGGAGSDFAGGSAKGRSGRTRHSGDRG